MPTRKKTADMRLLGTWRSDRRRTLKEWVWKRGTPPKRRKLIRDIFGHLTIRYTRQRMHSDFKGQKDSQPYKVIGSDSDSVAIMSYVGWMEERRIYHIHFEGERYYWITIGRQREWFKRVRNHAG